MRIDAEKLEERPTGAARCSVKREHRTEPRPP